MIAIERKRTERSSHPFLLMLLETGEHQSEEKNAQVLAKVIAALLTATRETDVIGWYKKNACVGVLFTQLVMFNQSSILSVMLERLGTILRDNLNQEQFSQISISFHFFPDKWAPRHLPAPEQPGTLSRPGERRQPRQAINFDKTGHGHSRQPVAAGH